MPPLTFLTKALQAAANSDFNIAVSRGKPRHNKGKIFQHTDEQKKTGVWQSISDRVNVLGVAKHPTTDMKEKWRAMCGVVRKEMSQERSYTGKTGVIWR